MKDIKKFTGIGSRNAPVSYHPLVHALGYHLALKRVGFLSGRAMGMDQWFEGGVVTCARDRKLFPLMRIYLPSNRFQIQPSIPEIDILGNDDRFYWAIDEFHFLLAKTILHDSGVCVYLDKMKHYAQLLFCRNVFQVIDFNLTPVDLLIFYADENREKGTVSGGTRIAVYLARHLDIPCFNLKFKEDREALFELIDFSPGNLCDEL